MAEKKWCGYGFGYHPCCQPWGVVYIYTGACGATGCGSVGGVGSALRIPAFRLVVFRLVILSLLSRAGGQLVLLDDVPGPSSADRDALSAVEAASFSTSAFNLNHVITTSSPGSSGIFGAGVSVSLLLIHWITSVGLVAGATEPRPFSSLERRSSRIIVDAEEKTEAAESTQSFSRAKLVTALVSALPIMRSWIAWILTSTFVASRRISCCIDSRFNLSVEVLVWMRTEFHLRVVRMVART
jgi:hypothetical protein